MIQKEQNQYSQKQSKALEHAYKFFNEHLFNNKLNPCMLTISHRNDAGGGAIFSKWKDSNSNQKIHEITICTPFFKYERLFGYSILVHEMVHILQFQLNGKGSHYGYHDKEWGWKMKDIGLIPSDTGVEGGKQTGVKMSHYIEEGGQYEQVFSKMPKKCLLPYSISNQTVLQKAIKGVSKINENKKPNNKKQTKKSKLTYTCEKCGMKVWGKPNLKIKCGECDTLLLVVVKKK